MRVASTVEVELSPERMVRPARGLQQRAVVDGVRRYPKPTIAKQAGLQQGI